MSVSLHFRVVSEWLAWGKKSVQIPYSCTVDCTTVHGEEVKLNRSSLSHSYDPIRPSCVEHTSNQFLHSLLSCSVLEVSQGKYGPGASPPLRWSSSHRAAVTDFKLPELFRKQVLTVFFFLPSSEQVIQDFIHLSTTLSCGFYLTNFLRGLKSNIQLVVKYYFYTNEV